MTNGLTTTTSQTGPTSAIMAFNFSNLSVRVVVREGNPWFVAADVCAVLEIQNPTDALTRLEFDERSTLASTEGGPNRNIISESGLYSLIMTSRKPEARKFKRWITAEVIPAIRRTGSYSVQSKPLTASDLYLAQAQFNLEREARIENLINQQESMSAKLDEINRMLQRSEYSTRDMKYGEGNLPINFTAALLGTGATRLTRFLREQHMVGSEMAMRNHALEPYVSAGLLVNVPKAIKWDWIPPSLEAMFTPKGRRWMFENACRGWLDPILDRKVLETRVTSAVNLLLPLDCESKPR